MQITETIKAGYHLYIETSENDYDNVRTEMIYLPNKAEVEYFMALWKLMRQYGNDYTDITEIFEEVKLVPVPEGAEAFTTPTGFSDGFIGNYIGWHEHARVYRCPEDVKIMFYPYDVNVYNVTGEFD